MKFVIVGKRMKYHYSSFDLCIQVTLEVNHMRVAIMILNHLRKAPALFIASPSPCSQIYARIDSGWFIKKALTIATAVN